jgi:hypothetical protein
MMSSESEALRRWYDEVTGAIIRAAHEQDAHYAEIVDAASDGVTVSVSFGGVSFSAVASLIDEIGYSVVERASIGAMDDANTLLCVGTNEPGLILPAVCLAQCAVAVEGELWLYSLPVLLEQTTLRAPRCLIDRYLRIDGPHPLYLEQTIVRADTFMRDRGAAFLTMIRAYLRIAELGLNPHDDAAWS